MASQDIQMLRSRTLKKDFDGVFYQGSVTDVWEDGNGRQWFRVKYEDSDEEDMDLEDLEPLLEPVPSKAAAAEAPKSSRRGSSAGRPSKKRRQDSPATEPAPLQAHSLNDPSLLEGPSSKGKAKSTKSTALGSSSDVEMQGSAENDMQEDAIKSSSGRPVRSVKQPKEFVPEDPTPKRRGRPPGKANASKDKTKTDAVATQEKGKSPAVATQDKGKATAVAAQDKGKAAAGTAQGKGKAPAAAAQNGTAKKTKAERAAADAAEQDAADFAEPGPSKPAQSKGKGQGKGKKPKAGGNVTDKGKEKATGKNGDDAADLEGKDKDDKRGAPDKDTILNATWTFGLPVNLQMDERPVKLLMIDETINYFYERFRYRQITEHERYENANGLRDDGKKMSKRPDLVAFSDLKKEGKCVNRGVFFGHVPGIPCNKRFYTRAECVTVGLHCVHMKGIDYIAGPDVKKFLKLNREELKLGPAREKSVPKGKQDTGTDDIGPVALSIVVSGCYGDDEDSKDDLTYTGEGGNNYLGNKKQVADQSLTRGNQALVNNVKLGIPVRVIRKNTDQNAFYSVSYRFDGLYDVTEHFQEKGKDGFLVNRYKLLRKAGQPPLHSNKVVFGGARNAPPKADPKTRPCIMFLDLSKGGETLPVAVVNELDPAKDERHCELPPGIDPEADKNSKYMVDKKKKLKKAPYDLEYVTEYIWGKHADGTIVPPPEPAQVPDELQGQDPHEILKHINHGSLPYQSIEGPASKKKNLSFLSKPRCMTFECGDWTGCQLGCACPQRVVQNGMKFRLEVFHTGDRGWGVRTWDFIPAYSFITAFWGELNEVIDTEEDSYLFECVRRPDFDYEGNFLPPAARADEQEYKYQVDARHKGNVARFINHSCAPNTFVQPTCINTLDENYCAIAFFAMSNIDPWSELTYDYGPQYVQNNLEGKCRCGAPACSYLADTEDAALRHNLAGWKPHRVQEKNKQRSARSRAETDTAAATLRQLNQANEARPSESRPSQPRPSGPRLSGPRLSEVGGIADLIEAAGQLEDDVLAQIAEAQQQVADAEQQVVEATEQVVEAARQAADGAGLTARVAGRLAEAAGQALEAATVEEAAAAMMAGLAAAAGLAGLAGGAAGQDMEEEGVDSAPAAYDSDVSELGDIADVTDADLFQE